MCSEAQKNVENTSMAEHSAVQFFLARTEALGLARAFLGVHSTPYTAHRAGGHTSLKSLESCLVSCSGTTATTNYTSKNAALVWSRQALRECNRKGFNWKIMVSLFLKSLKSPPTPKDLLSSTHHLKYLIWANSTIIFPLWTNNGSDFHLWVKTKRNSFI